MAKALSLGLMERNMMETGRMTTLMVKAQKSMQTGTCTSVIGSNGRSMARVCLLLKMEVNMLAVTSMIREKAKVNFIT